MRRSAAPAGCVYLAGTERMKIVGFEADNGLRLGVVEGDAVIDLQSVDAGLPGDLGEVLRRNKGDLAPLAALAKKAPASARRPLAGLKFALPVVHPGKIVCLGLNYLDHVKEGPMRDNVPKFQSIFFRMLSSLTSHGQPLMRPKKSIQFDYEGELVVIIGKRAKHLTLENAADCVAGYTIGNEGSIREYQRHTTQWGMGKNFDRSGSVGPWMVTADELPRGGKGLKIETRLNGKTMQSSNTDHFMFPVAESLVYLTEGMTLEPGDMLFTGTPSGVGHARKPEPVWMKAGDTAEVEIEGIGILRNPIEDEK
jgi:2-keto-4-pentenoate hydratase/2-oxohepta-3-ene-1,7-dioic acid hydratase in catechol pathway